MTEPQVLSPRRERDETTVGPRAQYLCRRVRAAMRLEPVAEDFDCRHCTARYACGACRWRPRTRDG